MKKLQDRLLDHLQKIVIERNPYYASAGHLFAREYIRSHFAKFGEVVTHEFEVNGNKHQNLILNIAANNQEQRSPLIIGAHYDTVPACVGADDNASGVAVLLELTEYFSANPLKYPVQLIAFDMEEYGLSGSHAYANKLKNEKQKLRLMISLEMLGYCDRSPNSQHYPAGLDKFYPNTGDFIGLIGSIPTIPDLIHLQHHMKSTVPCEWLPAGWRGLVIPDTRRSDHAPFWDAGYKALMVTDTANMRNPHYHKSSDRLETLDLEFLTNVCQGLIVGIKALK
ncbi:MAG: M28 family peptidase [Pseudanabaena sp. M135S2SP2A07QC]|nr:M28 family peptidase [Pseudanabaena sp. M090S1SP2A07QC]MCA6506883.1 M28 family peptidase [Pseudanabaena sp. M172S2SP2A07QC]MCA6518316.1 M28 family peptidase [Pseudanabaena sp. M110S1SP2A07QC]MCA6523901.1 M28 family peptidase [Pseudanabaena sp. M051S1SP2A07QC]MCA6529608.1 M28 family peptidase [Pseudanabaena sp. M125S2SP2A07QC]MCA6535863.1 M28 family peptidase [Pseudanabaena sp. M176S2SP2A07QC]MCA6537752.1 M28 family peptidase [Pseudanabaena sp. M037S2SP2A07QC]MCA6543081.1 M28 family peptid